MHLAVDDFGTGYSSLSYLRRFPVDMLKIDRSLRRRARRATPSDSAIVAAIITLAHTLGPACRRRGRRDVRQRQLAELGCDLAQGFHLAEPMPAAALAAGLAAHLSP